MTTDILIKSCKKDLGWLTFSLRSIQKFCTGFRQVVLLFPEAEKDALDQLNLTSEKIFLTKDRPDFYLWQQVEKLRAYKYSGADYITFVDSDVIFTKPCCPQDFLGANERPTVLYTPYSALVDDKGAAVTPWQAVTEAALQRKVDFEFMRRFPMTSSRWLLQEFEDFMRKTHNMPLEDYVMSRPSRAFSEFNAMFAFAFYFQPEVCNFVCTEPSPIPPPVARQFWSWSGLTESERSEMERILA